MTKNGINKIKNFKFNFNSQAGIQAEKSPAKAILHFLLISLYSVKNRIIKSIYCKSIIALHMKTEYKHNICNKIVKKIFFFYINSTTKSVINWPNREVNKTIEYVPTQMIKKVSSRACVKDNHQIKRLNLRIRGSLFPT